MKKIIVPLIAVVLSSTYCAFSSPVELDRISSDANWLARIDCRYFVNSELGQMLIEKFIDETAEEKLDNLTEFFGFHPLYDVDSIILYGQGDDKQKAVVLIEGDFDKARLLFLVSLNPEYTETQYGDLSIKQWLQKDQNASQDAEGQMTYGCFYRDDLIILGSSLPTVKHAIDVLDGSAVNAATGVFSDDLLQNQNSFFQVAAYNIAQTVADKPEAIVIKQAEQLALVIGEEQGSVFSAINLTMKSEEATTHINQFLNGIIAYLILTSEEQPGLAELAQMIKLSQNDNTVQIRLDLESEVIKQIVSGISIDSK